MIETPVVVKHQNGLDGRPIALLVQEASQYSSKIFILADNKKINAKSIMGIFSLDLLNKIEVTVHSDACDALMEELKPFIVD